MIDIVLHSVCGFTVELDTPHSASLSMPIALPVVPGGSLNESGTNLNRFRTAPAFRVFGAIYDQRHCVVLGLGADSGHEHTSHQLWFRV